MGGFDDDMGGHSAFSSMFTAMPGMAGGMPRSRGPSSFRSRQRSPGPSPNQPNGTPTPSEITRPLKVSLEELFTGTTKRLKIGRRLLSGEINDKVLEIEIQVRAHFSFSLRYND